MSKNVYGASHYIIQFMVHTGHYVVSGPVHKSVPGAPHWQKTRACYKSLSSRCDQQQHNTVVIVINLPTSFNI